MKFEVIFELLIYALKNENLALQNGSYETFKYYYFCVKLIKICILVYYNQEKYYFIELMNNY